MKSLLKLIVFACAQTFAGQLIAHAQEATNAPMASILHPLGALLSVHGKSTSSREFDELKRQYNLKLYSIKDELKLAYLGANPLPANHYQVKREAVYGGSGLLIVAVSTSLVEGDLGGELRPGQTTVNKICLVLGECDEADLFGTWKGEMPIIELPSTPDSLLRKYRGADTDMLSLTYANAAGALERNLQDRPIRRTRKINYYVPPVWTEFPYAFVFDFDRLAMIEIWPASPPGKIVRPKRP
jgi:hypothetical protein